MLVVDMMYYLCNFMLVASIITLICSIKNKKRNICKNIIAISIIYIIVLIFDMDFMPSYLDLDVGFEVFVFRAMMFIAITLFIISIIISNKKRKKLEVVENSKKDKIILCIIIMLPLILLGSAYFKERYYINNSELIINAYHGEGFGRSYVAYAINDNYCEKISIGASWMSDMIKHLPRGFKKLDYYDGEDKVKTDDNKIVVYKDNKIIYEGKLNYDFSKDIFGIEEVFYK